MFGDVHLFYGLAASLCAAGVSLLGVSAVALFGANIERHSPYFSAFAVGMLTVAVLLHLIPEAIAETPEALAWVGTGFMLMTLIGIAVHAVAFNRPRSAALTFGYASIIALAAHSMLDGAIYVVVFQEGWFTGWFTISGLLMHEFPEGIIAYFLLVEAGQRGASAFISAFVAAGATTVFGALVAHVVLMFTPELPLGALFGGAAGALIYVLVVHLGPHAATAKDGRGFLMAQLGVIVAATALILQLLGGGHGGHGH